MGKNIADRKTLEESWRKNIQATMILKRLSACARGEIEMSASSIKAAEICLRKVVPDLSAVKHEGESGGKVIVQIMRFTDDKPVLENPPQSAMVAKIINGNGNG